MNPSKVFSIQIYGILFYIKLFKKKATYFNKWTNFISSQDISSNKFTYFFQKWTLRQVFLWLANGVNHVVPQFVKWQKISSNVKK